MSIFTDTFYFNFTKLQVLIENWNIGIGATPNIIPRFTISLVIWIIAAFSILICFIKMLVASINLPYFFFCTLSSTQNFVFSDLTRYYRID